MGIFKKRPPVRESKVEINQGNGWEVRRGRNLDDVLRVLVWDLKNESGWSLVEASEWLGVNRTTLQSFLDEETCPGTSITTLTDICTALKITPDEFFQDYEGFAPETRASVRYAEDQVFNRFRTALTVKQARDLLDILDNIKKTTRDLSKFLEHIKGLACEDDLQPRARKREKSS